MSDVSLTTKSPAHFPPSSRIIATKRPSQRISPLLAAKFADERAKLFAIREKRVHPHRDEKILTAWNGLMISALARAAQARGD